jgi:lipopolysaccharide export system protein LptA
LTVLSGGAVITSDATTIIADEIELWGTDFRYSMAKGAVTATDTERGIILKSDSLFYDREKEIIRVNGFIDMQDLKNDVVARGGFFEYYGEDEIALIQIGVRILKVDEDSELACRSEFARYLRDDEVLELSGMPHVTRNNDVYTAARITINLDTDEILLDRDVSGRLVTESEEEEPLGGDQTGSGESAPAADTVEEPGDNDAAVESPVEELPGENAPEEPSEEDTTEEPSTDGNGQTNGAG